MWMVEEEDFIMFTHREKLTIFMTESKATLWCAAS
jgi:hypothetical protein